MQLYKPSNPSGGAQLYHPQSNDGDDQAVCTLYPSTSIWKETGTASTNHLRGFPGLEQNNTALTSRFPPTSLEALQRQARVNRIGL